MDLTGLPMVRIEIDSMKHSILKAITDTNSSFTKDLEPAIERAIQSYDWEGKIKLEVHDAIAKAVARFYSYGSGYDAIEAAVFSTLEKTNKT